MLKEALAVWILSASAWACSFFAPQYRVPLSFSVHVKNDYGPVVGLKLRITGFKETAPRSDSIEKQRARTPAELLKELEDSEEVIAESATDASGEARFTLAKTGHFTLAPVHPANRLDWVELDVFDQASSAVVELPWPSGGILRTAHVRGKLTKGLLSSRSTPLKNIAVSLHTLTDYTEIAATTTGDDGAFDFKGVSPGLYFLQILATPEKTDDIYKPKGNIAIYVAPDDPHQSLTISTVNTSCGLSYDLEENKARYKPEACFKGGKPVRCDY